MYNIVTDAMDGDTMLKDTDVFDRTIRSLIKFRGVAKSSDFQERCDRMIYEALLESSGVLDFGQRLQRFIYERSDFNIPFEEVTLNDLRSVIMEEFSFRPVPAHFLFDEGSTSLMQLSKY